jgi:ketosteroid isomerase-like protein
MNLERVACLLLVLSACSSVHECARAKDVEAVRGQLERAYLANEAAFASHDPEAVMRLRHPDFHTVDHAGRRSTRQEMSERTAQFIGRIERFDLLRETIRDLEVHGDTAIATVFQETARAQRLADGALHRVETTVTQREWWRCTPEGWLLWRVDEVEQGTLLVDGRPPE